MRRRLRRGRGEERKEVVGNGASLAVLAGPFFCGDRVWVANLKFGHYKSMESRPVEERRGTARLGRRALRMGEGRDAYGRKGARFGKRPLQRHGEEARFPLVARTSGRRALQEKRERRWKRGSTRGGVRDRLAA
jgi:hypothetical protein